MVLPEEQKARVWELVSGERALRKHLDGWGFGPVLRSGRGIVLLFAGLAGTGKTAFAHAVAHRLGGPVLAVRTSRLLAGREPVYPTLAELLRVAQIADAVVLMDECEVLLSERNANLLTFLEALDEHHGVLILTTNLPGRIDPAMTRRITFRLDFEVPPPLLREQIWEVHLPAELPLSADVDIGYLARTFEFTGAAIRKTVLVALARQQAGTTGDGSKTSPQTPLDLAALCSAAETQLGAQFDELAVRTAADIRFDQLVLPEQQMQDLQEVRAACRHHERVLNRWGFGRRLATGRGICVLFDGPPGTGKTLAAELLSSELRRPMYRVHIPQVVSKWVGETERNIAEIFARARAGRAILLFDEADSLFGARATSTSSAADRYANMEVNQLLQEIERYDGITILTTNLFGNLDEALQRRIQFRISFPMPGPEERGRIWEVLLPPEAPRQSDVALDVLGRRFELSGGHIKNALLRAAYRASDEGTAISQRHLIDAAMAESRAQGKLVRDVTVGPTPRSGLTAKPQSP